MIVKGQLKQISSGFRKTRSSSTKYDFIEIGDYTIRRITMDSYIGDRLATLLGKDVEVSIMKGRILFPKSIVAIRTDAGKIYRNEHQSRFSSGIMGFLLLGFVLLAWFVIPYGIVFGLLGFVVEYLRIMPPSVVFILLIVFHCYLTYSIWQSLYHAYNAFGRENSATKVI